MKEKMYGLAMVGLLVFIPSLTLAQSNALTIDISKENVSPGDVVEVVVSVESSPDPITAIETFVSFDENMFERVGSGGTCDSSEYRDIKNGDWFIESCLPEDTHNGETYYVVSKAVAFSEAGYGIVDSRTQLYGMLLRVKEGAEGSGTVTLSSSNSRVSKIFYEGIQYAQEQVKKTVTVTAQLASSGSSSSSNRSTGGDEIEENDVVDKNDVEKQNAADGIMSVVEIPEGYDTPEAANVVGVTSQKDLEVGFEEVAKVASQMQEQVNSDTRGENEAEVALEDSKDLGDPKQKKRSMPLGILLLVAALAGIAFGVYKKK